MENNIYDNDKFFDGYIKLRKDEGRNYNDLLEQPAMSRLLPNMQGRRVLDVGCGFGENCRQFSHDGASYIVGVDISKNMLALAEKNTDDPLIRYYNYDMMDIEKVGEKFDLIYSSLAVHYIENFAELMRKIGNMTYEDGELLLSMEHPVSTASRGQKVDYLTDKNGNEFAYKLSNYMKPGIRKDEWFVSDVVIYHRPMGVIINDIICAGFRITSVIEPMPTSEAIEILPALKKEIIRPSFLIIKAVKILEK